MLEKIMVAAVGAFLFTVLFVVILRRLAPVIGLVDKPGGRKRHHGEVAVVGGVAMVAGCLSALALAPIHSACATLLACVTLLVTVGLLDDRFQLSPWLRLVVQGAAGIAMVQAGVAVQVLGLPDLGVELRFGDFGPPLTLLIALTMINAYNMVDGLDGLAAGLGLIALLSLLLLSEGLTVPASLPALLAPICAALLAFLIFNAPLRFNCSMRCFMGDSGSTLLGFLVCWFGVDLSQGPAATVHPVTVLWIAALPLMELGSSVLRRLLAGRSPLHADADHFHHKLQRAGFTVPATCAVLLSVAALFAAIGLLLEYSRTSPTFSALLLLGMSTTTSSIFNRAGNVAQRRRPAHA